MLYSDFYKTVSAALAKAVEDGKKFDDSDCYEAVLYTLIGDIKQALRDDLVNVKIIGDDNKLLCDVSDKSAAFYAEGAFKECVYDFYLPSIISKVANLIWANDKLFAYTVDAEGDVFLYRLSHNPMSDRPVAETLYLFADIGEE